MKNYFITLLLIVSVSLCGMEDVTVLISLSRLSASALEYCPSVMVDRMKQFGIPCEYNTPFIVLPAFLGKYHNTLKSNEYPNMPTCGSVDYAPKDIGNVRYLPLSLFKKENGTWKNKDDEVIVLQHNNQKITLKISTALNFANLIQTFQETPNYAIGLQQHLIDNGILEKTMTGKIIHGPNSFFAKEYVQEKQAGSKGYFAEQQDPNEPFIKFLQTISIVTYSVIALFLIYKFLKF